MEATAQNAQNGHEHQIDLLPRANAGGYHYIHLRSFALDLVEQLLAWHKAGLFIFGFCSAMAETWTAELAHLLLEKATGAPWEYHQGDS